MLLTSVIALLPALALASPIRKRYTGVQIRSFRDNRCLALPGSDYGDGTVVISEACVADSATWDIDYGSGSILLHGTSYALDAGTTPANNQDLHLYTSSGVSQQTWFFTGDNRIAITGGTQCLDESVSGPQTYQCTPEDTNQVWFLYDVGSSTTILGPSTSTASAAPTSSPSATTTISARGSTTSDYVPPTGSPVPDSASVPGHRIHPKDRNDLCVTVQNGFAGDNTIVAISYCVPDGTSFASLAMWNITSNRVQLENSSFCLSAGTDPSNGSPIDITDCASATSWTHANDKLQIVGTNLCLDVVASSTVINRNPYSSYKSLQTWECTANDANQVFYENAYGAPASRK
ncbi:hypothetical protein P7C73_g4100, partial [Tremellales sp. Uapishka_1]